MRTRPGIDWLKVAFVVVLIAATFTLLSGRHSVHGDGVEYILQTQAIALHGTLRIVPADLLDYWNRTNPYDIALLPPRPPSPVLSEDAQAGGNWGGLYGDRFGAYRYYHFWAYSLCVAPVYWLLHHTLGAPFEYHAFRILNTVCLLAPFILAWRRRRSVWLAVILLLGLCSPLVPYADWQHPELFCFSVMVLSFWLAGTARHFLWSPLLLGIAAAQNVPIGLCFPFHGLLLWRSHGAEVRARPWVTLGAYGLALFLPLGSLFYWHHAFGVFNVIAAVGLADFKYASLGRVGDLFFSPAVGAVWLYPTVFLSIPWAIGKRGLLLLAGALVTMAGMALVASATRNFNADQVGSLRYAVWILAPLWFLVLNSEPCDRDACRRWLTGCAIVALVANVLMIGAFKYDRLFRKDARRMAGAFRKGPEVAAVYAATHYNDDVEILVENILEHELRRRERFGGVYLWNLGPRSAVCVIAGTGLPAAALAEWLVPGRFNYTTEPRGQDVFQFTNGLARLVLPPGAVFREHPYLGPYITVWLDAAATHPRAFTDMHVRESRPSAPQPPSLTGW